MTTLPLGWLFSHKCEHTGRAAFTPGWLRPAEVWIAAFSSHPVLRKRRLAEPQQPADAVALATPQDKAEEP